MANKIREWRKTRDLTLETLADELGTSAGHLHKWETGKVSISVEKMIDIAQALDVSVVDLIEGSAKVPVVGQVGAGVGVHSIDDFAPGQSHRLVRCPAGLDPTKTAAVEVVGDSMLPIEEGWLLFYTRDAYGVPTECLGRLCIAEVSETGARYVKRVKLGRKPGTFDLISTNAREMENVRLEWAAPVLEARPPIAEKYVVFLEEDGA